MTTSLYDISVASYLQIGTALAGVLDKGAAHCAEQGIDLEEVTSSRIYPNMAQFRFQVFCVAHHSVEAVRAFESGEFGPPTGYEGLNYTDLQALLGKALEDLAAFDRDHVNSLAGGTVTFRLGELVIPFTTENFALSFSLPNFYFHAATAYDLLRAKGVPIGKRDFLGQMRAGT